MESAPKQNIGNQETPQQQTALSSVKDSSQPKSEPPSNQSSRSGQVRRQLVQLEESLKEKAGFSLEHHSSQSSSEHSDTALKEELPVTIRSNDSTKSAPSEELSGLTPSSSGCKEKGSQELPSDWNQNQQQIVTDGGKSCLTKGIYYPLIAH